MAQQCKRKRFFRWLVKTLWCRASAVGHGSGSKHDPSTRLRTRWSRCGDLLLLLGGAIVSTSLSVWGLPAEPSNKSENLVNLAEEMGDNDDANLIERICGGDDWGFSNDTVVLKGILYIREGVWTIWLNDQEIDSLSSEKLLMSTGALPETQVTNRTPSTGSKALLSASRSSLHPSVTVGPYQIFILAVQPRSVTFCCGDRQFFLQVGRSYDLKTHQRSTFDP